MCMPFLILEQDEILTVAVYHHLFIPHCLAFVSLSWRLDEEHNEDDEDEDEDDE